MQVARLTPCYSLLLGGGVGVEGFTCSLFSLLGTAAGRVVSF